MNKVVSFNKIKKEKTRNIFGYLESQGIEKFEDLLMIKKGILDLLYSETDIFLRENRFDLKAFSLDEKSARDFMSADFMEAVEEGDETLSISYAADINGINYRTLAIADINEKQVEIEVNIYKQSGEEWLIYDGSTRWIEGPGKDFF